MLIPVLIVQIYNINDCFLGSSSVFTQYRGMEDSKKMYPTMEFEPLTSENRVMQSIPGSQHLLEMSYISNTTKKKKTFKSCTALKNRYI